MEEEKVMEKLKEARVKIADAIEEYVNLQTEYSIIQPSSNHFGLPSHTHMLSDAVVCYQTICLAREDGKPAYSIGYFSTTFGTLAADFGIVCAARDAMSEDL